MEDPGDNGKDLDFGLLAKFLVQLNITRRHVGAYPQGHPMVGSAIDKTLQLLQQLLSHHDRLSLGVARNTLLVGNQPLPNDHPIFQDLARVLFEHGVVAITFSRDLSGEDLRQFDAILLQKPEDLREKGGIAAAAETVGLRGIRLREVDYDQLRVTEEARLAYRRPQTGDRGPKTWENLVKGMLSGTLDPLGESVIPTEQLGPDALARILNTQTDGKSVKSEGSYDRAIVSFLQQMDQENLANPASGEALDRLSALVEGLNPELRRQLLKSVVCRPVSGGPATESLLDRLAETDLLEVLEDLNREQAIIPPVLMGVINKLSRHGVSPSRPRNSTAGLSAGEKAERLRVLFHEEHSGDYVPERYGESLDILTALDRIAPVEGKEAEELKKTLLSHSIEKQVACVALELLPAAKDISLLAALERTLLDLCAYFLEIGDFATLTEIIQKLSDAPAPSSDEVGAREKVRDFFSSREFLEEVLNGPELWGKSHYTDIRQLIEKIGSVIAPLLLDRLAEESDRSLRRYFLDCLAQLGTGARTALIERLDDDSWYFLRNLIMLLRKLDDPEVLPRLRRFADHPHPRVRQEILRTFLHFRDPQADKLLLEGLESPNREWQLWIVQLAESSRSSEVVEKLLDLLLRSGFTESELVLKRAVVHALAAIGSEQALPVLGQLIKAKPLLNRKQFQMLKKEMVRSLAKYPLAAAGPLLAEITASDQRELAALARRISQKPEGEGK